MNSIIDIELKPMKDTAIIPKYATDGSAGVDLHACIDAPIFLEPGSTVLVGTGLSMHMKDRNAVALLMPRSGLGHKHGIVLGNLTGVIDSDYQGEIMVSLWNRSNTVYEVQPTDRIAQMLIIPVLHARFSIVDSFEDTLRGSGGFGSTGQ